MFTIQTAVTIVTASLASYVVFEFQPIQLASFTITSIQIWTVLILLMCAIILVVGRYKLLDKLMKIIIIVLTISTITAVFASASKTEVVLTFGQIFPEKSQWIFLIAFMGWMPAPMDISVWHSVWALEKQKQTKNFDKKTSLFDFNIGYLATIILGLGFLALGAFVLYNSGESLSTSASGFAEQLIVLYTKSLGNWSYLIIGIAALTTMFSTTLTTFDASPRVMSKTSNLIFNINLKHGYIVWLALLFLGTIIIFFFLTSELGFLVKTATILSFLTAPFYAIINFKLIMSKHVPTIWKPNFLLQILSWFGIIFLIGFGIWYLLILNTI